VTEVSHDSCACRQAGGTAAPDEDWIAELTADGPVREDALRRLHALLLRGARFQVSRMSAMRAVVGAAQVEDIIQLAADEAMVAVLSKLTTFEGRSRFTTWAYKFALLEAAVRARRRPWQGRELPLELDGWAQLADHRQASPAGQAEASELINAVRDAIAEDLTPQQRAVLVAITLNDIPIDVLAERRHTTRGALYKTLHDARRKLRARLAQDGLAPEAAGE
jgi:RNA polymerase sigma-70 factor, ECF subfamily